MGELICTDVHSVKGAFTLEVPSFRLARGEKVALLGENGCGKTTFLQALAGLHAAGGTIQFAGERWDTMPPGKRALHMSYLPQEAEVLFNLTVGELLDLTLHPGRLLTGDARRRVLEATEMLDFQDRIYPSLSGGEKRRAMLARIFCRDVDFVFLDEPTAPLDMRHSAMLMRYAAQTQSAVVAAMHDLNLAVRYFERFLLMKNGRILFDKRKEELGEKDLEAVYGIGLARYGDHFVPER